MTRVTVLMGGWSSEREVSLSSGRAALEALDAQGYETASVDVEQDVAAYANAIVGTQPDVVFNALHGRYGEDGCIQGILDIMAIPYTNSGLLASAMAMHKPIAKMLMTQAGIPVAEDFTVSRHQVLTAKLMEPPFVLKPIADGSSVGVRIIRDDDDFQALKSEAWTYGNSVMMEKFIPGRELTVAVMGDEAIGVTDISTDRDFYDYKAKYETGGSAHTLNPDDLPAGIADEAKRLAVLTHKSLHCRGVSRTDFRLTGEDLYVLEINTQPGLTSTSLLPEQALAQGISFPDLIKWMVEAAACDA